jgi:hypothetical protein
MMRLWMVSRFYLSESTATDAMRPNMNTRPGGMVALPLQPGVYGGSGFVGVVAFVVLSDLANEVAHYRLIDDRTNDISELFRDKIDLYCIPNNPISFVLFSFSFCRCVEGIPTLPAASFR